MVRHRAFCIVVKKAWGMHSAFLLDSKSVFVNADDLGIEKEPGNEVAASELS